MRRDETCQGRETARGTSSFLHSKQAPMTPLAENVLVESTRDSRQSPVSGNVCESETKASEDKVAES